MSPLHRGRTFLLLLVIYLAVAVPFRSLEFMVDLTDLRPVCMLMPVFGLFFGPVGASAFAIGNVLADAAAGSLSTASIGGLVANFAAVYTYHLLWNRRGEDGPTLADLKSVAGYAAVALLAAVVTVAILVPVVHLSFPDASTLKFARAVILNNTVFALMPGMALIVILRTEYHLPTWRRVDKEHTRVDFYHEPQHQE